MARPVRYVSVEIDLFLPWNRGILRGIEAFAGRRPDWHLLLHRMLAHGRFHTPDWSERADGLIAEYAVDWAVERKLPQVQLATGHGRNALGVPRVNSDFHALGVLAASHLGESGYARLACFALLSQGFADVQRDAGFRREASRRGLEIAEILLPPSGHDSGRAIIPFAKRELLLNAFRELPKPLGFFARNLSEAYLAHSLVREAGLHIPNQVGMIVGGNDPELLRALRPPITSISRNTCAVGYRAAEQLQRIFDGQTVEPLVLVPPGELVERGSTRLDTTPDAVVRRARDIFRERIAEPPSMPELGRELGVSPSSLRRRFHAALNRSPVAELQRIRLERAKQLLEHSGYSISEVSAECGFADQAQLSRAMRSATGFSPSEFRKRASESPASRRGA